MAEYGGVFKLVVILCLSFKCLMRPVISTIDQLPDLETIGIRATKLSSVDRFIHQSEQLAIFPQLGFSCPTTVHKLWYIGQASDASADVHVDSLLAPQVLIWSKSEGTNTYQLRRNITLNTIQDTSQVQLIASTVSISVSNTDIIGIRYHADNDQRSDVLYEPEVEDIRSYFINEETEYFNPTEHEYSHNYPLIAVKTENPACANGFLSISILKSLLTTLQPLPLNMNFKIVPLQTFVCAGTVTNVLIGGVYNEEQENVEPLQVCIRSAAANGNNTTMSCTITTLVEKSSNVFSLISTSERSIDVNSGDILGIQNTSRFSVYGQESMSCEIGTAFERLSFCSLVVIEIEYSSTTTCVSTFEEDKTSLEQKALLIDPITFITNRPTVQSQITTDESLIEPTTDRNAINRTQQLLEDSLREPLATAVPLTPTSEQDYVCIFTNLRFENNGEILSWTFAASYNINNDPLLSTQQYPELQVWRSGPNDDSYQRILTTVNQEIHNVIGFLNVYKVELKIPLTYNKNDIIGLYQPGLHAGALNVAFIENSQVETLVFQADSNTKQLETTSNHEGLLYQPLMTIQTSATTTTTKDDKPLTTEQDGALSTQDEEPQASKTTQITDSETTIIVPGDTVPQRIDIVTVAAAGGSGFIAVILFLIITIVIAIVVMKRRRKRSIKSVSKDEAIENPVYTEVDRHNSRLETEAQLYETPISLRSSQPQTIPGASHEEPQPYETPTSSLASSRTHSTKQEPFYHVLEQNIPSHIPPEAIEHYDLGVVVPTREQRNGLQNCKVETNPESVYVTLRKAQGSVSLSPNGSYFKESEMFWVPASNQEHLYQQLANKKYREIPRHHIHVTGHLGGGQFGTVSKGLWQKASSTSVDVAIKTLQPDTEEKYKIQFLQEAAINGQFRHPNIITLYGVVTIGEPVMIILELLANGDLRSYLNKHKPVPGEMATLGWPQTFLEFCQQIAAGMEYLSKKGFVHRDLAARNILVSANKTCKITDFGMSRDLDLSSYYISSGGMVPVKWTAPEAIQYRKYSESSDVWSFGALMYEIWSFGRKPFEKYTNQKVIELVNEGYRLPPPPGCPREIYRIMIQCWHPEPSLRPSFAALLQLLLEPENELLHWSPEELNKDDMAGVLGAPLNEGKRLYHELQNTYVCAYETVKSK